MLDSMTEVIQNFYNSLTPILPFLDYLGLNLFLSAVVFEAKTAINLIKMKRDNINKKITYISPELLERCKSIDDSKLLEPYKQRVLEFYNVLKQNFSDDILENFLNNVVSLEIWKEKKGNKKVDGLYYSSGNKIELFSSSLRTLTHELLHMASFHRNGKISMVGFHINYFDYFLNNDFVEGDMIAFDAGAGFNEGYTVLLNKRYFNDDRNSDLYEYLFMVARSIEQIVGKDVMEECYFKHGLHGLCKHLEKYLSHEDIYYLIDYTDSLYNYILNSDNKDFENVQKKDMQIVFSSVNHILTKGYIKKSIDSGEFNKDNLATFINYLPYEYTFRNERFKFKEDVNNYVVEGKKTL